jgi:DNA-binding PadR family transcriptional regulator
MRLKMVLKNQYKLDGEIAGRHVKAFLDLLILGILDGRSMYGYKIIAAIHKEFGVLLSPGSLYPLLHILEEKRLVESQIDGGRITYSITSNGKKIFLSTFTEYKASIRQMDNFIGNNGKHSTGL